MKLQPSLAIWLCAVLVQQAGSRQQILGFDSAFEHHYDGHVRRIQYCLDSTSDCTHFITDQEHVEISKTLSAFLEKRTLEDGDRPAAGCIEIHPVSYTGSQQMTNGIEACATRVKFTSQDSSVDFNSRPCQIRCGGYSKIDQEGSLLEETEGAHKWPFGLRWFDW